MIYRIFSFSSIWLKNVELHLDRTHFTRIQVAHTKILS